MIGKFLSVDPLTKQYPMLTPYQFASNKPISGVDLDGLEYLDYNEVRIKIIAGEVHINLANFHNTTRKAWEARDAAGNWPAGNYGWPTQVGSVSFPEVQKSESSASMDPTYTPDANPFLGATYLNQKIGGVRTTISTRKDDMRFNAAKINAKGGVKIGTGVSKNGRVTEGRMAGAALAINAINWGLEQIQIWSAYDDQIKVREHKSLLFNQVMTDINQAISEGMILEKFQNTEDLSAIMSIVLSGTITSSNQELNNIGIEITKKISKNYRAPMQIINTAKGSGSSITPADATQVNKQIIVPIEQK